MKVKLLVSRGGIDFTQNVGDEIEVSDGEGQRMVEAGQAIPVRTGAVENTMLKKQKAEKANKG